MVYLFYHYLYKAIGLKFGRRYYMENLKDNYTLHFVENEADIDFYWKMFYKYVVELLENDPSNGEEDFKYFLGKEYKEKIMNSFRRDTHKLEIVFLQSNGKDIGFAVYVIYDKEDGKCFILEFCITPENRNKGIGKLFFKMLSEQILNENATYFALHPSNENNKRFWENLGFINTLYMDEYGNFIYENHSL